MDLEDGKEICSFRNCMYMYSSEVILVLPASAERNRPTIVARIARIVFAKDRKGTNVADQCWEEYSRLAANFARYLAVQFAKGVARE